MNVTDRATDRAIATLTARCLTPDDLLDLAAWIIDTEAKAERRDRSFSAAHDAGFEGCEVCGRALRSGATARVAGSPLGPTCTRKLARLVEHAPRGA
tara:strand:+ start:195 stop:485 length:291 start_codon:yes stop_codon:yes gene_type:complete